LFTQVTAIFADANPRRSADTITGESRPKAGGWNSPNRASWRRVPRPAVPSPPNPPSTRP